MTKIGAAFAALFLLSIPTMAQTAPATEPVTMGQVLDMMAALQGIDGGSLEQCGDKSEGKAAEKPCPFRKSLSLLRAMARNMVELRAVNEEFSIQRNAIRAEVLGDAALNEKQHEAAMMVRLAPVLAQIRQVHLVHLRMSDFDLERNHMPAGFLAALKPIIDDLIPE